MSKIAIIFVHKGTNDSESKKILDIIDNSGVTGITKIIANEETQKWLKNNSKGVVVKKYPCFLVAQESRSTQIYNGNDVDIIIEMIKNLD